MSMSFRRDEILRSLLEDSIPPTDDSGRGHDFHPPWRDRFPDGTLGPWYGPTTASAYRVAQQRYLDGRGWSPVGIVGGGPCVRVRGDERLEIPMKAPTNDRYDVDELRVFVEAEHAQIGLRLLEVHTLFWRQRQPVGWIARRLGIARTTVEGYITDLRRRSRRWHEGRGK